MLILLYNHVINVHIFKLRFVKFTFVPHSSSSYMDSKYLKISQNRSRLFFTHTQNYKLTASQKINNFFIKNHAEEKNVYLKKIYYITSGEI